METSARRGEVVCRRRGGVEDDIVLGPCGGDLDRQRDGGRAVVGIDNGECACRDRREAARDVLFFCTVEALYKGRCEGRFFGLRLAVDRDCRFGNGIFLSCNTVLCLGKNDLDLALNCKCSLDRAGIGGIGHCDLVGVVPDGKLHRYRAVCCRIRFRFVIFIGDLDGDIRCLFADRESDVGLRSEIDGAADGDFRFVKGMQRHDRPEAYFGQSREVRASVFSIHRKGKSQQIFLAARHLFDECCAVHKDEMPLVRSVRRFVGVVIEQTARDRIGRCEIDPNADFVVFLIGICRQTE